MNTLSTAVSGCLITLSSLNPQVSFEIRWSRFIDGKADVEVLVCNRTLAGSSEDVDPDKARIKAINYALRDSGFQTIEPLS